MPRLRLKYGTTGSLSCLVEDVRLIGLVEPPPPLGDVCSATTAALAAPLEFPPLRQATVPGDRITIVVDSDTPRADDVLAGVWRELEGIGVEPASVLVLHPPRVDGSPIPDPRGGLPRAVAAAMQRMIHDPANEDHCCYLAATASGERIYLAREVVEADFVICIGAVRYDSRLGYRGTQSALYPGLSNVDAIRRTIGAAHVELGPDDPRPLRELVDEVGWLLGMQFVVQVVPSGAGGVAAEFAGLSDAVFRTAVESLSASWRIEVDRRPELVVAAVESEGGRHTWAQVAQALDVAQRIVARDGRVLLLTQLDQPLTPGIELLREARTPHEALRPILDTAREDRETAWQLAHGVDRANVYFLSRLAPDLVEELFMVPLTDESEALKVLETGDDVVVLGGAQHAFVRETEVTA